MDIRSCRMVCGLIYIHSYQTLFALAKNVCVLVAQLCPTFCDPMDCSQPDSSAHGILQARILEWVAIPFSGGSSWPRDWIQVSCLTGRFFTIWARYSRLFLYPACPLLWKQPFLQRFPVLLIRYEYLSVGCAYCYLNVIASRFVFSVDRARKCLFVY